MREIPWVYYHLRSKLVYLQVFSQLVLSVSAAASAKRRDSFVRNMVPWREEVPSVSKYLGPPTAALHMFGACMQLA